MKPRFKDKHCQGLYELLLNSSEEELAIIKRRGSSIHGAFMWGYEGKPMVGFHRYPRGSWAYAAYCAGKELLRRKG